MSFVSVAQILVNNQPYSSSVLKITDPYPTINWEYSFVDRVTVSDQIVSDTAAAEPGGYELRVGTSSAGLGSDAFNGDIVETGYVESDALGFRYRGARLTRGEIYYGQLRLTDHLDNVSEWATFSFAYNVIPYISEASITPLTPTLSDELLLSYEFVDDDGDDNHSQIWWFKNGVHQPQFDNITVIESKYLAYGDEWNVQIYANDGYETGAAFVLSPVTVTKTTPVATTLSIEPSLPTTLDPLYAKYELSGGEEEYTTIRWFVNDVLQTANTRLVRLAVNVGDEVYFEAKASDGEASGNFVASATVTIERPSFSVSNLTVDNAKESLTVGTLTPTVSWKVSGPPESHSKVHILVGTAPGSGNILDTEIEEDLTIFAIPGDTLVYGGDYYVSVAAGDAAGYGEFSTTHFRTTGSLWADNVDNATGWTVEITCKVESIATDDSSSSSSSNELGDNYQAIRIYDGTYYCEVRIYPTQIVLLPDETYDIATTGMTNYAVLTIVGKGSSIKVYKDYELLLSATLTRTTSDKYIEFGAIGASTDIEGSYLNVYYTTDGDFEPSSSQYYDMVFTDFFETRGSIDYITGYAGDAFFASSSESDDESSAIYKLSDYRQPVTVNPSLDVVRLRVNDVRSNTEGTATYVSHGRGATLISNYIIPAYDVDLDLSTDLPELNNWDLRYGGGSASQSVGGLRIDTTGSYGKFFYSQNQPGTKWFDGVSNDEGWTVEFSAYVNEITDDTASTNLGVPDGFGLFVSDGVYHETVYLYTQEVRFGSGVAVSQDNTLLRQYVLVGEKNYLNLYAKLPSDSSYSLIATSKLTSRATMEANGGRPSAAESSGTLHAVWHDDGGGYRRIYYSSYDASVADPEKLTKWTYPLPIVAEKFGANNPCIASDSEGRVYVAFESQKGDGTDIGFVMKNRFGWGTPYILATQGLNANHPAIAVDSDDNVHVVWEDYRDVNPQIYYCKRTSTSGDWSEPIKITGTQFKSVRPSIDCDNGKVYVSFTELVENGTSKVNALYLSGSTWSTPTRVSTNSLIADYSDVAAYGGNVYVTWQDNKNEDFEIFVRPYSDTLVSESTEIQLTANATASRFPRIAIHTGSDTEHRDVVIVYESGGDVSPYDAVTSTFSDTAIALAYRAYDTGLWYSSNQTGGADIIIDHGDTRYSRRPVVAKKYTTDAHILYETEIPTDSEYAATSEFFTNIRDAVFAHVIDEYDASLADKDLIVSAQRPRREIRFGDFSDARNVDLVFGYLRYYVGDGVAPFAMSLINDVGECYESLPNSYGDAWLSIDGGLRFFKRDTSELASVSGLTGTPKKVRFGPHARMYVLNGAGTIFYSDDFYTFTTTALGPGVVDFGFDSAGSMWILTEQHLLRYDVGNSYTLRGVQSLIGVVGGSVTASSFAIDPANVIWICTNAGLISFTNGTGTLYSPLNSGIPSQVVTGIAIHDVGERYVTTNAGVAKMVSTTFEKIVIDDAEWIEDFDGCWWMNPNVLWLIGGSKLLQVVVNANDTYSLVSFSTQEFSDFPAEENDCADRSRFVFEYTPVNEDALFEVLVNDRVLKHGYSLSGNKLKFECSMLTGDLVSLRVREDISAFGTLARNRAEKELFGDHFRYFTKMLADGSRIYGSVDGDVDQLLVYNVGDTSVLPYDKITLDKTPPFGELVFDQLTSSRRIGRFYIESYGDNLSGIKEMIVSNYSNLTSDGESALEWQPFQESFLHDLGSDLGNVTTQLTFESGSGKRISTLNAVPYVGTGSPAKIYKLNLDTSRWSDVGAFTDEPSDTVVEFMISYKQSMVIGTSSETSGGQLWKTADGVTYSLISSLGSNLPKCATVLNGNLYIGTGSTENGGKLFRYNNVTLSAVFAEEVSLGSEISCIAYYKDYLYVGTQGSKGHLYRLTTDVSASGQTLSNAFKATLIYVDSDTKMSAVAVAALKVNTSDGTTAPPDDIGVFGANANGGRIVKSINGNAFGTSFYTKSTSASQLKVDSNTGLLHATVGRNLYKYKSRTWQPIFTNDENIEDVLLDQQGFYAVSSTGVKYFSYEKANKRVYLALRDVAGNATQEPGTEATDEGTEIPFVEISIEDLDGFVNANRILELDEYGVEVFSYDGVDSFYSAQKVETERAEYWSEIFNGTSDHVSWDSIYWDAIVPEGCDLTVYVRSGANRTAILEQPFLKRFGKEEFEGGDISSLSGQYIQFKVVMTSEIRGNSPRLYGVNIRGLSRSSVHFFTTNFTLPSRILKGILTADTFVPVAADVVFGINTNDSVDFSDYQIIEPDRMFTVNGDQIGKNLRIGVKLISPLQVTPATDDVYEYGYEYGPIYNNVIDFDFTNTTGNDNTFEFKVELYEDFEFTTKAATLYTGSAATAWSADNDEFPADGLEILAEDTVNILAAVKGNAAIRCNTTYFVKVYYGIDGTFTSISDDYVFIAGCNPTFNDTIVIEFTNVGSAGTFNFRSKFYSDAIRTSLEKTYYSGSDATGWTVDDVAMTESGMFISSGQTVTIEFTPPENDIEAGVYYLVIDEIHSSLFENISNSHSIRISNTNDFECGEYSDVPVVKNIAIMFELEDYTEQFGSRERTRRTIQLNL